jgi:ribonuclease HI
VANKVTTNKEISDALIFCNYQVVVKRLRTTIAKLGQKYILIAYQYASTLQMISILTNIRWVPRYVKVEENEKVDPLAKKEIERKRKERNAYISITYIK